MYLCSLKLKENVRISQAINWTIVRLQSLWLVYRKRPRKSTVQGLRRTELTALRSHIHTPKAPPQQVLEHTHTCTPERSRWPRSPLGAPLPLAAPRLRQLCTPGLSQPGTANSHTVTSSAPVSCRWGAVLLVPRHPVLSGPHTDHPASSVPTEPGTQGEPWAPSR